MKESIFVKLKPTVPFSNLIIDNHIVTKEWTKVPTTIFSDFIETKIVRVETEQDKKEKKEKEEKEKEPKGLVDKRQPKKPK